MEVAETPGLQGFQRINSVPKSDVTLVWVGIWVGIGVFCHKQPQRKGEVKDLSR